MKLEDHWFFSSGQKDATSFHFDAEETLHATRALRLKLGDELQWLDGKGFRHKGVLSKLSRAGMEAQSTQASFESAQHTVVLGQGILHDTTRLEWLVEKAVELGVSKLCLLQTQRVQRSRFKSTRLHAKAIAAMKQSGRAWLPEICEMDFAKFFTECGTGLAKAGNEDETFVKTIAHCYAERPREPLSTLIEPKAAFVLLIGPEGDFTLEEIGMAIEAGFTAVSLGSARLRSETAAIAALSLLCLRS